MKVKAFIEAIKHENLGFSFGRPWRYDENHISCVLPLIRQSETAPAYLVLPQTKKVKITDIGSINKVLIFNGEDLPVFLRVGELLKGATQERATTISQLVMPKEKIEIDVTCVHASKGIVAGSDFSFDGYVPQRDSDYITSRFMGATLNQGNSWNSDRAYFTACSAFAPDTENIAPDNLKSVRDAVNENLEEVLKKVPLLDNQIGIAIIDTKGLYSLDCFDLHIPFKAVKEALVGKESLAIAEKDESGVFQYIPQKAKETVKKILEAGFSEKVVHDTPTTQTIALDYKNYIGEVVLQGKDVIHLLIARKSGD